MPSIQRKHKEVFGIINSDTEDQTTSYCTRCYDYDGSMEVLGDRLYLPNETIPNKEERDRWLQCSCCGIIVPKYSAKTESKLQDVTESSTNPFDDGNYVIGLDNRLPRNSRERQREKLLDEISKEPDAQIRQARLRGLQVEMIEDSNTEFKYDYEY